MHALWLENLSTDKVLKQEGLDIVFHPASLLKLFVAVAARDLIMQAASFKPSSSVIISYSQQEHLSKYRSNLIKALEASLRESDNDALHYLVDFISETESGLELEASALDKFVTGRYLIHSFFSAGYSEQLRIPNKCFECDYYGRDKQLLNLQANQCAIGDVAQVMKTLMASQGTDIDLTKMIKRSPNADFQASNFIAAALGLIDEFYSKAGWTSRSYHDACVFKHNGEQYLLVVMTEGGADKTKLNALVNSLLEAI